MYFNVKKTGKRGLVSIEYSGFGPKIVQDDPTIIN